MEMNVEMKFTTLPNGFRCYYQHWLPEKPRALIIMVHGLGDHVGRYNEFVSYLSCREYACALYDQRGHGLSEGRRGHLMHFDDWLKDLDAFIDFTRQRLSADVPMFLMGGSLGGLICINYALSTGRRIAGVIAASAAIEANVNLIPAWQRTVAKIIGRFLPFITVDNRLVWENMTRDPDEMADLVQDRLFHRRISLGTATEIDRRLELVMGMPHRIRVPMLLVAGSDDRICNPGGAKKFVDLLSSTDKKYIEYEGMRHDILHDIGRKRVMEDIERWISERTGKIQNPKSKIQSKS